MGAVVVVVCHSVSSSAIMLIAACAGATGARWLFVISPASKQSIGGCGLQGNLGIAVAFELAHPLGIPLATRKTPGSVVHQEDCSLLGLVAPLPVDSAPTRDRYNLSRLIFALILDRPSPAVSATSQPPTLICSASSVRPRCIEDADRWLLAMRLESARQNHLSL